MAPSSPWKAKAQKKQTEISQSSFPELKAARNGPASQYAEAQEEELIVLASMYPDEFEDTRNEAAGAWKKAEPSFNIRIKSYDGEISVLLQVVFTATYPKSLPLLSIRDDDDLREGTRYKVSRVIEEKPKELLVQEQPMIDQIVEAIREVLDQAAQALSSNQELPSLEEERANHEAEMARLAQEEKAEEERKRQEASAEEENALSRMVSDEVRRQKEKATEARRKDKSSGHHAKLPDINGSSPQERIVFEQPIILTGVSGDSVIFQAVTSKHQVRRGPVSQLFTVRPVLQRGDDGVPLLALKQAELSNPAQNQAQFKKAMQSLEWELDSLKKLKHRNILAVLDYQITKDAENGTTGLWNASILCEFAEKGSLEELLDLSGTLSVQKARAWTIELLDGLRYLHENGIVHQNLHTGNILLVRSSTGEITAKIGDAGFERRLHDLSSKKRTANSVAVGKSAYWLPPELAGNATAQHTQKSDVWDFGVVFAQMLFGLDVLQKYSSSNMLMESLSLSDSLDEFLKKFFKTDPKRRPRAFELSSCEFLATDAPIMADDMSTSNMRLNSLSSTPLTPARLRRGSSYATGKYSRYKEDFVEESRLGKGGFGEVVKARRKLDGQLYAIKKITQKSGSLTEILKEIRLLSQLSHPYVVRYFTSWTELEDPDSSETEDDTISDISPGDDGFSAGDDGDEGFDGTSGGLDFISSSRIPFEFGYDTDENESGDNEDEEESSGEEDEDEEEDSSDEDDSDMNGDLKDNNLALRQTRSDSQAPSKPTKTTLYISMQYCEKRTLRDLIKRDLYKDNESIWRLLRQMLEGLAHIHSLNIVHRDLKPENVFLSASLDVQIGDFGLATAGQYSNAEKPSSDTGAGEMTASVGTPYYTAPEVRSSVVGSYNSKVDMYSLGVIHFEMNYHAILGMERDEVLRRIRQEQPSLPSDFDVTSKAPHVDIMMSLLVHNPKERPSATELLQSGKLPVPMESETIRQTLAGLASSNSPYYPKMMNTLFSRPKDPAQEAKDLAYDMSTTPRSASDLLLQSLVRQKLTSIFRHHGAIECPRAAILPRSSQYGSDAVQLLDPSGTLVQLPYDLTLPHARTVAKHAATVSRTFAFGNVFRDRHDGAQPSMFGEVDFDIVTTSALDLALKEAEVIKVLDEIVSNFPSMSANQMCFHVNHSDLLNLIFDFCHIESSVRGAVAEVLSKLNIQQWTWQKIRNELRSPLIGVSSMSLDDLQRFDFRDTPSKAFPKLKRIFEGSDTFEKASSTIAHLNDVNGYLKRMGINCKVFINPLGSLKEKFYRGGVLFQVLYDGKSKDVFAAGGRYDSLIRQHRPRIGNQSELNHAVGFSLAWEKLSTSMARFQKVSGSKNYLKKMDEELQGIWSTRRCDVLVASFDATVLRTTGVEIVQHLWANNISAELAADARSPEDLLLKHRQDQHCWIITIKQDEILKVKSMTRKDVPDADINTSQLMSWLRNEIRDRDQREGLHERASKMTRFPSHSQEHSGDQNEQQVQVLVAQSKSKKSNRQQLKAQAQAKAASLVHSFLDGPIAAIETTDAIMDGISKTRLSDPESWRKLSQSVGMADRRYVGEIHDMLKTMEFEKRGVTKNAFVYNFRSGSCIYYDLSA